MDANDYIDPATKNAGMTLIERIDSLIETAGQACDSESQRLEHVAFLQEAREFFAPYDASTWTKVHARIEAEIDRLDEAGESAQADAMDSKVNKFYGLADTIAR